MAAFTNLIIKPPQNLYSTTKLNTFSWGYNPKLQSFFPTKPKISLQPLSTIKAAATTSNVKNGSAGGGAAKTNKEEDKVQHVHTVEEFEAALRGAKQKLVVVEYAASHSKQSSKMYPFMVNLSRTCSDVVFLLVMGDESEETRELCRREKIEKVPHFSFYKNMEKIHEEEGIGPDMLMGDVLYYGDSHSGVITATIGAPSSLNERRRRTSVSSSDHSSYLSPKTGPHQETHWRQISLSRSVFVSIFRYFFLCRLVSFLFFSAVAGGRSPTTVMVIVGGYGSGWHTLLYYYSDFRRFYLIWIVLFD